MGTTAQKLEYLGTTKSQLKDMINYGLPTEQQITSSTTFREYVSSIFNAFLEALRTPDTLFTNLPKKSASGSNISLTNVANAPMRITLSPSELTQDGTPTPSSPQEVHTISGDNTIQVMGKNLLNTSYMTTFTPTSSSWYSLDGISGFYSQTQIEKSKIFAELKGGQTYTLSAYQYTNLNSGANISPIQLVDKTGNLISALANGNNLVPVAFTPANDIKVYPRIYTGTGNTPAYCIIQLEKGNIENPQYEPYISQEANIELGTGNLLNPASVQQTTKNGVVCSYDSETQTITFNGTCTTDNTTFSFLNPSINIKANETLYSMIQLISGSSTGYFNFRVWYGSGSSFTTLSSTGVSTNLFNSKLFTSDTSISAIDIRFNSDSVLKNLQIKLGLTKKYENSVLNYRTNIIDYSKISTYEDKFIRTSGKNLFDKDNVNIGTGYIHSSLGTIQSDNNRKFIYISCQPNTDYTITKTLGNYFKIATTETTPAVGTTIINRITTITGTSATINSGANAHYLVVNFYDSSSDTLTQQAILDSIMINVGTTALDYEPYGNGTWYIKKNIGKVVLDGSSDESWTYESSKVRFAWYSVNTGALSGSTQGICNYFGTYDRYGEQANSFGVSSDNIRIHNELGYTTTSEWTTWLSSHNVIIYYPLATPTYTQITGTLETQLENVYQKLLSYSGTTNISQVNNDLPFIMNVSAIEV